MKGSDSLDVVYEDNHVLIVNKKNGELTQEDSLYDSVVARAKSFIKKRDGKLGNVYLHAVHRLDKEVSGLVVCAKTSKALSRLMQIFRDKQCIKIYVAACEGTVDIIPCEIQTNLGKNHQKACYDPKGAKALMKVKAAFHTKNSTYVIVELVTGKYHQIRYQLASLGLPIINDFKYGAKKVAIGRGIQLHHAGFIFPHPVTKEYTRVVSLPRF